MSDLVPILDLMEQGHPSETNTSIRGGILAESLNPGTAYAATIRKSRFASAVTPVIASRSYSKKILEDLFCVEVFHASNVFFFQDLWRRPRGSCLWD